MDIENLLEAAKILRVCDMNEGVTVSIPTDPSSRSAFNSLNDNDTTVTTGSGCEVFIRSKDEMTVNGHGSHGCAVKFGPNGSSRDELKVGGDYEVIGKNKTRGTKRTNMRKSPQEVIVRRFVQDNEAEILAFWNAVGRQDVKDLLTIRIKRRVKSVDYTKAKGIKAKTASELQKAEDDVLKYLRKELNDPDFDISFSSRP